MKDPILEIGARLKRTFAQYRLYGEGHESAEQAERELHETIASVDEPIRLSVEATQLKHVDVPVITDDRKEDSITRPLFTDGVEAITFEPSVEFDELQAYLHVWNGAITRAVGLEHTFSTLIWEMECDAIYTRFRPGLAEHGVVKSKASEQLGRTTQLLEQVMSQSAIDAPVAVQMSALSVLGEVPAMKDLDRGELERRAERPPDAIDGLTKVERAALSSGLGAARRGAGQRTLYGLWRNHADADPVQREDIVAFAKRIVVALMERENVADVLRALVRIAHDRPFLELLADEKIVEAAVALLSKPDHVQDALALIGYIPRDATAMLVEPMGSLPRDLRLRLAGAVAAKEPRPADLAAWALLGDAERVEALFVIAQKLEAEHLDSLIRVTLIHDDERVQHRGLEAVRTDDVPLYRALILDLLDSPAERVRHLALQVLVRAKDPAATAVLEQQLLDERSSLDLRKTCIRGLANVGGPHASRVLCNVLVERPERELRKAAALGLASAPSPAAIKLLEEEAGRMLGDRVVRDACKEALKRLENKA